MAYENQCGSCNNFKGPIDTNKKFDLYYANLRKGYCDWYRSYYWADDSCRHYTNSSTTCYITTIVCKILGLDDDCGVLQSLRNFRNNVMQKNANYRLMLWEYDIVGPLIAKELEKDYIETKDKELATTLFNFYIQPTSSLIDNNKYDEAVKKYQEMTVGLEEYYNLKPSDIIPKDYDYTKGGHGLVLTK